MKERKLLKELLMKALAHMGALNYHFLAGFSR
jgi:hypothetical protein